MNDRPLAAKQAAPFHFFSFFIKEEEKINGIGEGPCSSFIDQKIFESMAERAAGKANNTNQINPTHSLKRMLVD